MQNFVELSIEYTKNYESPTSFWRWSAYATIAAILRDNVYLKHELGKEYVNTFIILLADSAESRKGAPFKLISDLLNEVKSTKVIEGRNSIQYVLERLAIDVGDKTTGIAIKGGSGICLAEELAAFFVNDPALSEILCNIYDFKATHEIGLKGGASTVKNLCFSLFAASNETFLREVYNIKATYGGLLRRTFIVSADETRPPRSMFELSKMESGDRLGLVSSLKSIRSLRGAIQFTEEAQTEYDSWYKPLYNSYKKKPDRTGFTQGIHTLVLKLATIIAASKLSLELKKEDVEEAIERVTVLKPNYEKFAMSSGKTNFAEIGGVILNDLYKAQDHELQRKIILRNHWNDIMAEDLDKLATTLEQAGMLEMSMNGTGVKYKLTKQALEYFEKEVKQN